MNVELAIEVRDLIRVYPERHNQAEWCSDEGKLVTESCDTSACIAGWVAAVKGVTVADLAQQGKEVGSWAAAQLGLTDEEREELFYTWDNDEALAKLDILIDGGEIV